ncbi:MAG: hypothetical protein HY040_22615 [Planctomycetes bacterium]|nr:hypothetical protein [Planctomycetota bacterium]
MNTLVIVLSAVLGQAGEGSPAPTWQRDYAQAKQQAVQAQKPLAVFLAPGQDGLNRLVQGGLSPQAKEIMSGKFICVLIDTDTPEGKRMAGALEIGSTGLVISDRGGAFQAFWQRGELSNQNLVRILQRFSEQTSVRATEIGGRASFYPDGQSGSGSYTSNYPDGGCSGPGCSSCSGGRCGGGHCRGGHCGRR